MCSRETGQKKSITVERGETEDVEADMGGYTAALGHVMSRSVHL